VSAARDRPSTAPSGFPGPDVHIGIHPEDPVRETVAFARRVEALGFTGLWIADSQDLFRDCLVTLTAAALGTTSLRLTTGVVNPVLRHPAVLAGAAATLAEMATGRIGLGIGSGETSVQTAGLRPARLREMQEAIERIRAGLRDPWGRGPAAVPIALAATGPRALGLAGRVADSAYVKIGAAPQLLDWARRRIDDGAAERELADPCRLTLMVPVALGDTREAAIREIAGFAAASAAAVSAAGMVPTSEGSSSHDA
jgi:5,10-methylenetetrahydromethanopterin reductase